jgi:hypothetical protein
MSHLAGQVVGVRDGALLSTAGRTLGAAATVFDAGAVELVEALYLAALRTSLVEIAHVFEYDNIGVSRTEMD